MKVAFLHLPELPWRGNGQEVPDDFLVQLCRQVLVDSAGHLAEAGEFLVEPRIKSSLLQVVVITDIVSSFDLGSVPIQSRA